MSQSEAVKVFSVSRTAVPGWFKAVNQPGKNALKAKTIFLFMLPKYCSEMNEIETEWHQLKTHEIAGQMLDNQDDLAISVIDGMTSRSQKGEYTLERFKVNSA